MQKSRIGLSFQDHHTLQKHSTDNSDKQAGKASTCTHISWSGPPAPTAHVHKPLQQVLKPGELLALQKVQHPNNGKTSVNRLPLMKQQILSHYSSCFKGIGQFPEDPYKTCSKESSNPPWRCFQRRNQVFGGTRHSRRGYWTYKFGQFICYCGKGHQQPPCSKPHH